MKTIYLFILILTFSMVATDAFSHSGGGGDGSGATSSVGPGAMSAVPTISFYTPQNAVQCSHNIWDRINEQVKKHRADPNKALKDIKKLQRRLDEENNRRRIAKENAKPNKKIDDLIHQMRIRAILGDDPNALKNLNNKINKIGKRGVATSFILNFLSTATGY